MYCWKIDILFTRLACQETMSRSQWKAYFSMHVLGQTDMVYNPVTALDRRSLHQSCPWLAIVTNFEEYHNQLKFPDNCYHCSRPCRGGYCRLCIDNPCRECGEVSCGGYCATSSCAYCGSACDGYYCSKSCKYDLQQE